MNLVLRLSGEVITGQHVCCLGSQLAKVVASLSKHLGSVTWYSADVDVIGGLFQPMTPTPVLVGDSDRLIEKLQKYDQFLRGVFLAVRAGVVDPQFRMDVDTEDPVHANLGDATVEIRAFDTTYIEIITKQKWISELVERTFGIHADPE